MHGLSGTRIYRVYSGMKQRCCNPNNPAYKHYGGKGIHVCDEWMGRGGFERFYSWSMNSGYREGLTIDRINPNANYQPDNCEWVTRSENSVRANSHKYLIDLDDNRKYITDFPLETTYENLFEQGWKVINLSDYSVSLEKNNLTILVPRTPSLAIRKRIAEYLQLTDSL